VPDIKEENKVSKDEKEESVKENQDID